MGTRYTPFTLEQFKNATAIMGFEQKKLDKTWEWVFEGQVRTNSRTFPYVVRIYTSIDVVTGVTRECGTDAIRIALYYVEQSGKLRKIDLRENPSIHRTKNAIVNTINRVRDIFLMVRDGQCHKCGQEHGGMMVPREGRNGMFLGCVRYPLCQATRPLPNETRDSDVAKSRVKDYFGKDNPRP